MTLVTGITVNGLDLSVTYGVVVSDVQGWAGLTELNFPTLAIPGVPGETIIGPPVERPRRVSLKGWIIGTSAADARAKLDALHLALVPGLSVQLSTQDYSTRALTARVVDVGINGSGPVFLQRKIPVNLDFICHDPYWYDTAAQNIAAATAMPLGSAPNYPVITLTASGAVASVTLNYRKNDNSLISSLSIGTALVSTDVLVVDNLNKTIKKNGVSVIGTITSGDFFIADPNLHVQAGVGPHFDAIANTTMAIAYNKAWR
jgi:hypothetical protein